MAEVAGSRMLERRRKSNHGRLISLVVLCAGFFMIILDTTIVNVALPSIRSDLGFSQSNLAWVINSYLIAFGGLLLLAGRLGDLLGRKRVFMVGLGIFTVASLLCGLAQSRELLIGARFLQGVGGAMTSAVILGMIVTLFPQPGEQARAIGAYAFVGSAGASIGLFAGGALTQAISWHWIFFVNLPLGVATALVAAAVLDRDEGLGIKRGADAPGAVLVVGALMLGVYTILGIGDHGWGSARTLGLGAGALALFVGFVIREARTTNPLVPPHVFRLPGVFGANLVQVLMIAGLFGQQFLVALYLQRMLGFGPIAVGLATLPTAMAIGVFSLGFSARLVTRFGARATLLPALALVAAGLALLARAPVDGYYPSDVLPAMLLLGVGAGLSMPSLTTIAMSGVAPGDAGLASGLINTTQQVGAALGVAVLASLSSTRTEGLLGSGGPTAPALTGGYHLAFAVAAGFLVAAIFLTVNLLPPGGMLTRDDERA